MMVHKINMMGAILGARVSQLVPKGHSCLVGHTMGLASGPERGIKMARKRQRIVRMELEPETIPKC
jgi:hypothetical protein